MIGFGCGPETQPAGTNATAEAPAFDEDAVPAFDDDFWKVWGDGKAELASYHLTFPRYGAPRDGLAITIFVTETFSNRLRVKADPGKHPPSDEFPVMKLNLVHDFQTGIYDYNEMASRFITLAHVNGRPAGSPTKISFSTQEWCGHVWHQLLFDPASIRSTSHSYFDGEADQEKELGYPAEGLAADSLHHWARGMAYPALEPGETRRTAFLPSLQNARHQHKPLGWTEATISRPGGAETVTVPAGEFTVERYEVAVEGGPTYSFLVEQEMPHHIVSWETSDGERAELIASERLEYWRMNGPEDERALSRLGLSQRPPRTP